LPTPVQPITDGRPREARDEGDVTAMPAPAAGPRRERPFWSDALDPYAKPRLGRSLLDLATSVVPYLALSAAMYLALGVSYLLVLALAIPAAGFLVRTFILFHDCSHGSFLKSRRANAWLGAVLGLFVYSPLGWPGLPRVATFSLSRQTR